MSTFDILFDTSGSYTSESSDIQVSESYLQFTGSISESHGPEGPGNGDTYDQFMYNVNTDLNADGAFIYNGNITASSITIEFWWSSSNSIENNSTLLLNGLSNPVGRAPEIRIDNGQDLFFTVATVSGAYQAFQGFNFSTNTWYHIAFVYDDGTASLYITGSRQALRVAGLGGDLTPDDSFKLGRHADNVAHGTGLYDEFRMSDVARYSGANFAPPSAAFVDDANTLYLVRFNESQSNAGQTAGTFFNSASAASQFKEMEWTSSTTDPYINSESFADPPLENLTGSGSGPAGPVTQSVTFFTGTLGAYKTLGDENIVPSGGLFYDGFSAASASDSGSWFFLLSNSITSSEAVNIAGNWKFFNTSSFAWQTSSNLDLYFNTVEEINDNIRTFQGCEKLWVLAVGKNESTSSTPQLDSITVTYESASVTATAGGANIPLQHYVQTQIPGGNFIIP